MNPISVTRRVGFITNSSVIEGFLSIEYYKVYGAWEVWCRKCGHYDFGYHAQDVAMDAALIHCRMSNESEIEDYSQSNRTIEQ